MKTNGFTLIELLVAIAILGILSAVGIVAFTGYIDDAKRKEATTGLSAIYLTQEEFRSTNRNYYPLNGFTCMMGSDQGATINTGLFGGKQSLRSDNYFFCITTTANSNEYTAWAFLREAPNDEWYNINQNEVRQSLLDGITTATNGW